MTPQEAFDRYEAIRARLPQTTVKGQGTQITGLDRIADRYDAFVFDAYGVLNVGDRPIIGAQARVQQLRDMGKRVMVLTNAASFTRRQTVEKFRKLGFEFDSSEIISSREVCEAHLPNNGMWGVMAPRDFHPSELPVHAIALADDPAVYGHVQGFLLLSSADWPPCRQAMLSASLVQNPRPIVVANPDLVAPRETGLSLEPGFYAHELMDRLGLPAEFHGKPFPSVYDAVDHRLDGIAPTRIAMVGDTLHTDVLGAGAHGWDSVLITDHGLFAGLDVAPFIDKSGITPDWIAPSI